MRTALITGASSGLGLEFAKIFAEANHSLILVARRRDLLNQISEQLRLQNPAIQIHIIDMDLGKPNADQELFQKVKSQNLTVDFLINNAGFGSSGWFSEQTLIKEMQMLDLNIRTLVGLTHLFLPEMLKQKFGRILNIGSTAGFQPGPFMTTYYASKAFVNSFSEALHEELKGTGVTCTVLTPGATATEFAKAANSEGIRLFKYGLLANSNSVAKSGYRAMMAGKAIMIPGVLNNVMVQMLRFTPRSLVRKLAAIVNKPA